MSVDRVELVKQGYEAWNRGDRTWVLEHMSEDVEWITPPEDPDPGTYHGWQGVEQFWEQWRASVGQLQFKPEEFIDEGDHIVVVARRTGKGETSGLEVSDKVVQVFKFEGPKCVQVREHYSKEKAMREIGAEELADT